MKIVGSAVAAAMAIGLVGCGTTTQQPGVAAAAKSTATSPSTRTPAGSGKEGLPARATVQRGGMSSVNGVTVHPAPAPGQQSSRLPGLTGSVSTSVSVRSRTLVTNPLPRQGSAKGQLVAGHPTVLAQVPGSHVQVSNIAPSGDELQVGLTATSTRSSMQVLDVYRRTLIPLGFVEVTVPGVAGATAIRFTRGHDAITVSASTTRGTTSYTIFAQLHTTA